MVWETIDRPGYFGKRRDWHIAKYDESHGSGNWRLAWQWGDDVLENETAWQIYEDAYYHDSFKRKDLWGSLIRIASDIYDHDPTDVDSGLDYLVQQGPATHLQDISIRCVVLRRGWSFQGDTLIQIRSHAEPWGAQLSPGKVPFHLPKMIVEPLIEGWWDTYSIEDFYQSNKVIQVIRS